MQDGLPQRVEAGISPRFRRVARAGLAAGLSLAFIAAASSPALADQVRRNEWWLRTLQVTNAWETTRGSGVTIAVLGTGVDPKQPDLAGSVTTGPDYTNSGRTAGGPFWGINGTEVASLIAGHGHGPGQANGIIGIAPAAKILSVRVTLEGNDPSLSNQAIAAGLPNAIARGIRWAVRHHASVIDLPLDPVTTPGAPGSGGSPAEHAAVGYALAKHVVLVAPAGDGGEGTDAVNYPAAYHGVIAVGAFDRQFVKAPFSSHQPYVTVTAAGVGVTAASPSGTAASPSGSYPQLNSTSAASAMVAGIVALIQAQFPGLTPAQITHALTTSTRYHPPGGRADGSGFGSVDAARALTAAAAIAESVPRSAASGGSAQAPPSQPAVHSSPIYRNIRGALIKDAIIAGVVFLLLLGLIFAFAAWRRRKARSARLAEVRAAIQPPVRKPGAAKTKKGAAKKAVPARAEAGAQSGATDPDAESAEPQLEPVGFIAAPLGSSAGGLGASGFTGSASPGFTGSAGGFTGSGFTRPSSGFTGSGTGFTGSGFSGSAAGFTGSGFTGTASSGFTRTASPGFTGSASPGFAAASPASPSSGGLAALGAAGTSPPGGIRPPSVPGPAAENRPPAGLGAAGTSQPSGISPPPGLKPAARLGPSAASDPAGGFGSSAGPASPPGPATQDASPAGEATSAASQPAVAGTGMPPWALISQDPAAKGAASAAIPGSAFPGVPGVPQAAAQPAGEAAGGSEQASGSTGGKGAARVPSRLTQASRQSRTPQVSGRPPWDPAPEPNSELPWAQGPAPSRSGPSPLPMPEQVRPELPAWEEMAQEAWPGGPKAAAPYPPVAPSGEPNGRPAGTGAMPTDGLVPPQPDPADQPMRTEHRPGYAWNTGAGVQPLRAGQPQPGPALGGPGASPASSAPPASAPSGASPAAVSQPGVSPAKRPSLALPRRLGSSMARQPGGTAGAGPGTNPAGANPAGMTPAGGGLAGGGLAGGGLAGGGLAGPEPAGGGPAVPGTASGGLAGSGATGATASPSWPSAGAGQPPFPPAPKPATEPSLSGAVAGQPPFPPAPRPATEPSLPGAGQPERGPFPQAIKPPTDPGAAGTATWGGGTIGAKPFGGGPATPAVPAADKPANVPGPAKDSQPGAGAAPPSARPDTAKPGPVRPDPVRPGTVKPGPAKPEAAKPAAGGSRPPTAVPPWEITDSFLAVPAAEASAATGDGGPADSTESFPAVDSGAEENQRSFPQSSPGDSTESFPAVRPPADLEDAFRLFPPVRDDDQSAGDQD